jgi:hypothetical protein
VTLTFHALWMVCALGAATLAAVPSLSWRNRASLAIGFALSAGWLSSARPPDSPTIGVAAAGAAAVVLLRPDRAAWGLLVAGVLAGSWSALLEAQGVPVSIAIVAAALAPMASLYFASRSPSFLPGRIRDEALLGLIVGGVLVAMLPGVLDGWQAAVNLKIQGAEPGSEAMAAVPVWTMTLGAGALVSGALFSLWSRR